MVFLLHNLFWSNATEGPGRSQRPSVNPEEWLKTYYNYDIYNTPSEEQIYDSNYCFPGEDFILFIGGIFWTIKGFFQLIFKWNK